MIQVESCVAETHHTPWFEIVVEKTHLLFYATKTLCSLTPTLTTQERIHHITKIKKGFLGGADTLDHYVAASSCAYLGVCSLSGHCLQHFLPFPFYLTGLGCIWSSISHTDVSFKVAGFPVVCVCVSIRVCVYCTLACEAPCFFFDRLPRASTLNRIRLSEKHGDWEAFLQVWAGLKLIIVTLFRNTPAEVLFPELLQMWSHAQHHTSIGNGEMVNNCL